MPKILSLKGVLSCVSDDYQRFNEKFQHFYVYVISFIYLFSLSLFSFKDINTQKYV